MSTSAHIGLLLACLLNAAGCCTVCGTVRLPAGLRCPGLERELTDRSAEVAQRTPRALLGELTGRIQATEPQPDGWVDERAVACWWAAEQDLRGRLRHARVLHYRQPGLHGDVHVFTVGDTTILVHVYSEQETFAHGMSGGFSYRIGGVASFRGRLQDLITLDCSNGEDCRVIPQQAAPRAE